MGWRETYYPGDSRKTSGMPNLEKASEQAGSGSPGSFALGIHELVNGYS